MGNGELHVISTGKQSPEKLVEIAAVIHPYIDALHIREKTKTAKEIYEIVKLLLKKQVPISKIIINDRLDVAYLMKAQGVHLAYHSLPVDLVKEAITDLRVGCSVHSLDEALQAQAQGADYITYGHVFSTQSKPGLTPRGLKQLRSISMSVTIPVIAIGGIKPCNVRSVVESGAKGVAVMSGILEANNPIEAAKEYALHLSI
ncbi:thiazole tautomerase TenI [Ornithinibacillus sp. L9]|uniref:Thiamine-phosphate synthase n=1 Tax=Ornithinibacillus caprae TaxID=2678566 RepID=A0A6N8FDP2_9BACI|nr:thiazole tautomerase TenI [Ornithinibacillus caprae]MUK87525.1 thiazole tautomerase TenI [Ornithinibacillus caprae]